VDGRDKHGHDGSGLSSGVVFTTDSPQPDSRRLDPAIHIFMRGYISVDDRDEPGHDDEVRSKADRQMR
jgi:hypothetical protein